MVNVKFNIGNRILKIAKWYALIRTCLNLILAIVFIVLSYTQKVDGKIFWPYFWTGIGLCIEVLWIWIFEQFLYGFGLIVCNSAYRLSEKKAVTYLDYKEAKRACSANRITKEEMNMMEREYAKCDNGYTE